MPPTLFRDLASPSYRPRRILLVKPSALGDIVHTLPVLERLRRRFPSAHIDWLVAPPFAGLLKGHPDLDGIVLFDRRGLLRIADDTPLPGAAILSLGRKLADGAYDLVIDLQGLLRSGLLTFATLAPTRVGFMAAREGAWLGYTHRVAAHPNDASRHAVERYLDITQALGCPRGRVDFRFAPISPEDRESVDALLAPAAGQRFAVLLPGTNWATKRWPVEHYATLAALLRSETDLVPVIAGGPDAVPLARQIGSAAIDIAGRTTLPGLVELLRRADVVVANDSGPMHIASALGRPLVTIFGPTNPIRTGPFGRDDTVVRLNIVCSPCYSRTCSHTSCMHELSPARVMKQVRAARLRPITSS